MSNNPQNANSDVQQSGPSTITSPNADTRTLNHRGTEVGSGNVTRSQNTTGQVSEVLRWTIPKKFRELVIAGGKHWTKAELRYKETLNGDGSSGPYSTTGDIIPIAGETDVSEQPFASVVAVDTDPSPNQTLTVSSIDYDKNEITFNSSVNNASNNLELWIVMAEGNVQFRGLDAFGNLVAPLDEWGVPTHVFGDFNQEKNTTQIFLPGAGQFERDEELQFNIDSPRQVVWTDSNYPSGQYVSKVEQRVDVQL